LSGGKKGLEVYQQTPHKIRRKRQSEKKEKASVRIKAEDNEEMETRKVSRQREKEK